MLSGEESFGERRRLHEIGKTYLTDLARTALEEPALTVRAWERETVHGGFGGAVGGTEIHRFKLTFAERKSRSLILKILHERDGESETSAYYWKREYEIYRAGILLDMPEHTFSLPRIYHLEDWGKACWIWMEDIPESKDNWSPEVYADIAQRLGRFNGAWPFRPALPSANWLSRDWHSAIVPLHADAFHNLDLLLENDLARITLPLDAKSEIEAIWRDRQIFRRALAALPRTFCHFDAFRRNVIHRADEVVMLDWALAGIGGLGEDLVSLVAVSLYYEGYTEAYADELDRAVFAGYIAGLRQAGWRGDERLARIGYTCGMTLRGLAGVKQDISFLTDESHHKRLKRTHNTDSLEDIARFFADVRRYRLIKMARQARSLLAG